MLICPSRWQHLQFSARNPAGELIVYQSKVIPFGLATAPRVFAPKDFSTDKAFRERLPSAHVQLIDVDV